MDQATLTVGLLSILRHPLTTKDKGNLSRRPETLSNTQESTGIYPQVPLAWRGRTARLPSSRRFWFIAEVRTDPCFDESSATKIALPTDL